MTTRQVLSFACIAIGILLCSNSRVEAQETGQADQKAAPAQGPVMEADPSAQYLEKGFQRLYELNFDGACGVLFVSEEPPG
jgi:hypothetical protein